MKTKTPGQAVRINISMPPTLREAAEHICVTKGYTGLSDYIQSYIRRDAAMLGQERFALHSGA